MSRHGKPSSNAYMYVYRRGASIDLVWCGELTWSLRMGMEKVCEGYDLNYKRWYLKILLHELLWNVIKTRSPGESFVLTSTSWRK